MKKINIKKTLFCTHPEAPNLELAERAIDIAKKNQGSVRVFHTVGDYPEDTSQWWNVRNPEKLKKKIVDEREGYLNDMADRFKKQGVEAVDCRLAWGRPFLEITKEVMKNKYDMVMITTMRESRLSRMFFDCPTMDLLQHCPCTLWISKGKTRKQTRRVLAAVGGKERAECRTMDMKIVSTAAAIADADGSELHVVHAMPLYGGKGLKGKKLRADLVEYIENAKQQFLETCAPVVEKHNVELKIENLHFEAGDAPSVIVDVVEKNKMDLVVMGTMPPKGMPVFQIGNPVVTVFDSVNCDVVGVKPDDFVSLVEVEGENK